MHAGLTLVSRPVSLSYKIETTRSHKRIASVSRVILSAATVSRRTPKPCGAKMNAVRCCRRGELPNALMSEQIAWGSFDRVVVHFVRHNFAGDDQGQRNSVYGFYEIVPRGAFVRSSPEQGGREVANASIKKGVIGIFTGGGDVPGLNPAIRAVTIRAVREGYRVIGLRRGWAGLLDIVREKDYDNSDNFQTLSEELVNRAGRTGGTFLHTSRTNPNQVKKSHLPDSLAGGVPSREERLDAGGAQES